MKDRLKFSSARVGVFPACIIAFTMGLPGAAANAQVVLNEILHNPPGAAPTEERWEYIELFGRPGLSLDGLAVLIVNGGTDMDRNLVPETPPRLDEVFSLDGRKLGASGCFTLYNADAEGRSGLVESYWGGRAPENSASFAATTLDHQKPSGRLSNEGSVTYLLVRASEPLRSRLAELASTYGAIDEDFDGVFDDPALRAMQILDALAWSHRGGREYAPSTDDELSETVGLNPDAATRLAYQPTAPRLGHRTVDRLDAAGRVLGYHVVPTSRADESFAYGILDSGLFPDQVVYFDGFDFEGWRQFHTPTDRDADPYPLTVEDPEPDRKPFGPPLRPSADGQLFLRDMELSGLELTPNGINESPQQGVRQRAFLRGDVDFDGAITEADVQAARRYVGLGLGSTPALMLHDAQSILAVLSIDASGPNPWDTVVTEAHVGSIRSEAARGRASD